ncbi:hypothetical protein CLOM_g22073 [Closterium sp. NIES-68]|nr:hypothetical protein CLOM_g22073 [Closterium sp. NIES-68]
MADKRKKKCALPTVPHFVIVLLAISTLEYPPFASAFNRDTYFQHSRQGWASDSIGKLATNRDSISATPHSSEGLTSTTRSHGVRHDLLERPATLAVSGAPPRRTPVTLDPSQLTALLALNAAWRLWPGNGGRSTACQQWAGVKCNLQGMVTALVWDGSIAPTPIETPIPAAIGAFTALSILDLSYNVINGSIPVRAFQQLRQLRILDLAENQLIPPFPAHALQHMTGLRVLNLRCAEFELNTTLEILGYSPSLQYVYRLLLIFSPVRLVMRPAYPPLLPRTSDLTRTRATGALPPSLAAASNLTYLDLSDTDPSGNVMGVVSKLTSLTFLAIKQAYNLMGDFTSFSSLSSISSLQQLELKSLHNVTGQLQDMTFLTLLSNLRHLEFADMRVEGELPATLILLDKLTFLDLSYLYFNNVPLWLASFTNLRHLILPDMRNLRSGPVPQDLSRLVHLEEFVATGNGLVGFLPDSWASLTALTSLDLQQNGILGSIPASFSKLESLTKLDLSINEMSGSLPGVFSPSLEELILNDNKFEGSLPSVLGNLPSLSNLKLNSNRFTGTIPRSFTKLEALTDVMLSFNQLSGGLDVIASMPLIITIDIGSNNFSGSLPPEFSMLASLVVLTAANNSLSGEFPSVLLELTMLEGLDLAYNKFQGSVPLGITALTGLAVLHLDHNQFSGEMPTFLFQLNHMTELFLAYNYFQGSIPQSLASSGQLSMLNLEGNSFSGPLPDFAQWNTSLNALYLGFNAFTGSIPDSLSTITTLNVITLQGNQLSGNIPSSLSALTALDTIWLANNQLSGTLPDFFASLSNLRQLLLDDNQISGLLPPSFCNLKLLEYFGARNNRMYGPLPRCMFDFLGFNYLDLRNNSFYGTINRDFKGMNNNDLKLNPRPAVINLAYNYFYGEPFVYAAGSMVCPTPLVRQIDYRDLNVIGSTGGGKVAADSVSGRQDYRLSQAYQKGQASLLQNCLAVRGEAGCLVNETQRPAQECAAFCSVTDNGPCNGLGDCVPLEGGSGQQGFTCQCKAPYVAVNGGNGSTCALQSSSLSTGAIVGISVGCFVGLALIAAVLVVMLRPKKRRRWDDLDVCQEFSLSTMRKATNDWADDNVLGEGGFAVVYKGVNPTTGQMWAIKRQTLMSNDFEMEVRAMASLNHTNLVRLLGYCLDMDVESGKQEQILVYEFVANRDFQYHIHKTKHPLTLRQRLKLALGAAEGLAYLHGFANPIIHRDIKPANILVGDNLTAKIADFGLLKTLKFGDETATKVAGTPGYVDPDYNRTQMVTTKSDVYSFGVVLLEMLTARKVTMGGSSHIGKWASKMVAEYTLDDLRDKALDIPEEAIVEWADLALDCIKAPGSRRPEMRDVVRRLDHLLMSYTVEEEGENELGSGGGGGGGLNSQAGPSTGIPSGISLPSSGVMSSMLNSGVQSGVSGKSGVSTASTRSKLMLSVASALGMSEADIKPGEAGREGGGKAEGEGGGDGRSVVMRLARRDSNTDNSFINVDQLQAR